MFHTMGPTMWREDSITAKTVVLITTKFCSTTIRLSTGRWLFTRGRSLISTIALCGEFDVDASMQEI